MFPLHQLAGGGSSVWTLTLSANAANVNIKTELEALYGSMSSAVNAVVTVNSGVKIGSTSTSTAAMITGGTFGSQWPYPSTLKIINYGVIRGKGGAGGSDSGGGGGGNALLCSSYGPASISVDNTSTGNIFGGGGGGGSGGGATFGITSCGGGGGGGGQGDNGGDAGVGAGGDYPGSNGTAGNESATGTGGSGGSYSQAAGGSGGSGGGFGSYGNGGNDGWVSDDAASPTPVAYPGYSGGAPGKAIDKNGKTVTWIAGNNATQVKGAVS